MKVGLRAGAELDVLNQQELAAELAGLLAEVKSCLPVEPRWVRADASDKTDANGNVTLDVLRVPQGMEFRLGRLVLKVDGFTAAAPFNGGGVHVLHDGVLVSPIPGPLPAASPYPEGAQPRARNGALLQVQVIGGPAATSVTASIEGSLHVGAA